MRDILLLHGAIGAKDQLEPLASLLSANYNVHLLNFPGHGGGEWTNEPFSIQSFTNSVFTYIASRELKNPDIFGYSMGGYVALHASTLLPSLLGKIITLATKFRWDPLIASKEIKMLDADVIQQKVPAFAQQLAERHGAEQWRQLLDNTKQLLISLGENNLLQPEDLQSIKNETLLLLGDNDKMVSREETIAVKELLPNASYELIPETAHPIEQVDIKKLAAIINRFFK